MVGLSLLFVERQLHQMLDRYGALRYALALGVFLFGLVTVFSRSMQRHEDRVAIEQEREASKQEQKEARDERLKLMDAMKSGQEDLLAQLDLMTRKTLPGLFSGVVVSPESRADKALPDVELVLVYPQSVSVIVRNTASAGVADRPKYQLNWVNLDNLDAGFLGIPASSLTA
jgi:hypothetical protein